MDTIAMALNAIIVVVSLIAIGFFIRDCLHHKEDFKKEWKAGGMRKTAIATLFGNIWLFFDVIGIGSYGPFTATFKLTKICRDKYIPGTLQVSCVVYQMIAGVFFITNVEVDVVTLACCIGACAVGAYIGAYFISRLNLNKIRIAMGCALIVVAAVLILGLMGLTSFEGTELGLSGWKLILITIICLVLGALMSLGIGCYAPIMACVSLLGMDPHTAFPIMMGSCAVLIPVSAIRYLQDSYNAPKPTYDRKIAVIFSTIGLIGAFVAMFIITSMPLQYLKILVIIVLLFVAALMLKDGLAKKGDAVAEAEDAEMEAM